MKLARHGAGASVLVLVFLLLVVAACDEKSAPPTASSARALVTASAALAALSATPASTHPAVDAGEPEGLAGAWEGAYEAKKSSIELPAKVKPSVLGADDGKSAIGAGTVAVRVDAAGDVTGTVAGALGPGKLSGRLENGILRASVNPDDPRTPLAMTGVLVGVVKGDVIVGELHAAGPDAATIREATVQLKKKR